MEYGPTVCPSLKPWLVFSDDDSCDQCFHCAYHTWKNSTPHLCDPIFVDIRNSPPMCFTQSLQWWFDLVGIPGFLNRVKTHVKTRDIQQVARFLPGLKNTWGNGASQSSIQSWNLRVYQTINLSLLCTKGEQNLWEDMMSCWDVTESRMPGGSQLCGQNHSTSWDSTGASWSHGGGSLLIGNGCPHGAGHAPMGWKRCIALKR